MKTRQKSRPLAPATLVNPAIALAETWQRKVEHVDKKILQEESKLARLVQDKLSKNIVISLFDQAFRSHRSMRVVEQFIYLLKKHGIPKSFMTLDKWLMTVFIATGKAASMPALYFLKRYILKQTERVILDNHPKTLQHHVAIRTEQGFQINLNILGELILGEREAGARMDDYLQSLKTDYIDYISVKVSSIYSQLHPLAYEHSKQILKDRMRRLYTQAQNYHTDHSNAHPREHHEGRPESGQQARTGLTEAKFVNLDMEEYKDIRLTIEVFMEVLAEKQFLSLAAGIVLQAYLPDAIHWYKALLTWARKRIKEGGAPIKVRIVKGANLEVEKTEASLHGWASPILTSKVETDANYKKLVTLALKPQHIKLIHIGIASHNLFDIAYAYTLGTAYKVHPFLSFEMLEGIAESGRSVVKHEMERFVLYAPAAGADQFINAITYLVRRLDENTKTENYLRHSFNMKADSTSWTYLKNQFIKSVRLMAKVPAKPYRTQDRRKPIARTIPQWKKSRFHNEAETDFNLAANLTWAETIKREWEYFPKKRPVTIPVRIGTQTVATRAILNFYNPNIPTQKCTYKVHLAGTQEVLKAIAAAERGFKKWRVLSWQARAGKLAAVAQQLRKNRARLMGCMALVTGKVLFEGDNEITEAIDFAEYYPHSFRKLLSEVNLDTKRMHGRGVYLVITPWNFPVAIPAGGVLSALMAGNSVILKPAEEAMPIAMELAQCFWQAGIPKDVLQVVNCKEGTPLRTLVAHQAVRGIIFTGGTETVHKILAARTDLLISAETGGKNAMIVSAMADRDQAIKNIIQSAFSNTGQKCSAASLLILEDELFTSPAFKEKLRDACESLETGSAFALENSIGPLITTPQGPLQQALTHLAPGESWLVKPKRTKRNPRLLTPGIKWNVTLDSASYCEELFGPVLSVVRAKDFTDALHKLNTDYGLTSGLESLDEREIAQWKANAHAGNLYINRSITGAIVNRQPFGGFLATKSAYGTGIKAGGPNYLLQLMDIHIKSTKPPFPKHLMRPHRLHSTQHPQHHNQAHLTKEGMATSTGNLKELPAFLRQRLFRTTAVRETLYDYYKWMNHYFSRSDDTSLVYGQDNYLRYLRGQKPFLFAITENARLDDILLVIGCAYLSGNSLTIMINSHHQAYEHLQSLYQDQKNQLVETPLAMEPFQLHWEAFPPAVSHSTPSSKAHQTYRAALKSKLHHDGQRCCFVRSLGTMRDATFRMGCAHAGLSIIDHPPYRSGRLELVYYLQEQSISENYHRYGNLVFRDKN